MSHCERSESVTGSQLKSNQNPDCYLQTRSLCTLYFIPTLVDAEKLGGTARSLTLALSTMTGATLPPEAHTLFRRIYLKGPFLTYVIQYYKVFPFFSPAAQYATVTLSVCILIYYHEPVGVTVCVSAFWCSRALQPVSAEVSSSPTLKDSASGCRVTGI